MVVLVVVLKSCVVVVLERRVSGIKEGGKEDRKKKKGKRKEGRKKGRKEGRKEGRKKGRKEGRKEGSSKCIVLWKLIHSTPRREMDGSLDGVGEEAHLAEASIVLKPSQ